jgi:hypothetical protein
MRCVAPLAVLLLAVVVPRGASGAEPAAAPAAAPSDLAAAKKAAEGAGRSWLALVDAGRYAESWKAAAATFRAKVGQDQWVSAVGGVLAGTGKIRGRELASASYTEALPEVPGTFVILQFRSHYEKLPEAVETVTLQREGPGDWRTAGYFVRPAQAASTPPRTP